MPVVNDNEISPTAEAGRVADFIMFAQRSFLLDLSKDLNKGNISYAQFFLLGYLAKEDFLTMTNISQKMGHSTAAATGLVDRLEKLGYVQRLHAAEDRRKVMVQITRKGLDLVNRMRDGIAHHVSELMAGAEEEGASEFAKSFAELTQLFGSVR